MEELLRRLLNELSRIGEEHEELFDSECRERMSRAVHEGFLKNRHEAELASDFGLYTDKGNQAVRAALSLYIAEANAKAAQLGINGFQARLPAFQNEFVKSDNQGNFYDDFFGFWRASDFDAGGNLVTST